MRTIDHVNERMLPGLDVKRGLPNSVRDPNILPVASYCDEYERGQNGGRKDRRIESRRRRFGREAREEHKHKDKVTGNQIFIY